MNLQSFRYSSTILNLDQSLHLLTNLVLYVCLLKKAKEAETSELRTRLDNTTGDLREQVVLKDREINKLMQEVANYE